MTDPVELLEVDRVPVRLGQFLQLAGVAGTGSDAKILLAGGEVLVNGEAETRRGRQLGSGDVVTVDGQDVRVVGSI